jgi:hypothetical protein
MMLLLVACKRDEEVIIPNNEAPPDSTVTDLVLESYINRSYITLLGYQPTDPEIAQAKTTLRAHNVSVADRNAFLDQVIAKPGYASRMFDIGRGTLLNAVDTSDIRAEINLLEFILSDSNYIFFWDDAQVERDRLVAVLEIPDDLQSGAIDVAEMHRRLVTNRVYDEINMGTQNFVISMFQNFLDRYPTEAERVASETMVNGFSAQVFLTNGRSKTDFIAIFLDSDDYLEGQVRELFARYLYRSPDTEELESLTIAYRGSGDYKALQKSVLSKDEFVGL